MGKRGPKKKSKTETILAARDDGGICPVIDQYEIPSEVLEAAHGIGLTNEQIANFTDVEALNAFIIRANPDAAVKLMAKPIEPPKVAKPKVLVDAEHIFGVDVLAGLSSPTNRARKEQEQIESELRRKGVHNIETMTIVRHMKPENGRLHSTIHVKFRKEV